MRNESSISMDNAREADTAITSTPNLLADSLDVHSLDKCTMSILNIRIEVALNQVTEIMAEKMISAREETVMIGTQRKNRRRSTPVDQDPLKNTRKTKIKRKRKTAPNLNPNPEVLPGETTPPNAEHK